MDFLFHQIGQVQMPTIPDAFSAPPKDPATTNGTRNEYPTEVLDGFMSFDRRPNLNGSESGVGLAPRLPLNFVTFAACESDGIAPKLSENVGPENGTMFLLDPEAQTSTARDTPPVGQNTSSCEEECSSHALAERALDMIQRFPAAAIREFVALFNTSLGQGGSFAPLLQPNLPASSPRYAADLSNTDVPRQRRASTHSLDVPTLTKASRSSQGAGSASTKALEVENTDENAVGLKQVLQPGFANVAPSPGGGLIQYPPACAGSGATRELRRHSASFVFSPSPDSEARQTQSFVDSHLRFSNPEVASNQEAMGNPLGPASEHQHLHTPARSFLEFGQASFTQIRTRPQGLGAAATLTQHPVRPSCGRLTSGQNPGHPPMELAKPIQYHQALEGPSNAQDSRRRQAETRPSRDSRPSARKSNKSRTTSSASAGRSSLVPPNLIIPGGQYGFVDFHQGGDAGPARSTASAQGRTGRVGEASGASDELNLRPHSYAATEEDLAARSESIANQAESMAVLGICRDGAQMSLRLEALDSEATQLQPHFPEQHDSRLRGVIPRQNQIVSPLEAAGRSQKPQQALVQVETRAAAALLRRTSIFTSPYSSDRPEVLGHGISLAIERVSGPVASLEPKRRSTVEDKVSTGKLQGPAEAIEKSVRSQARERQATTPKAGIGLNTESSPRKTASRNRAAAEKGCADEEYNAAMANTTDSHLASRPKKKRKRVRFDSPTPSHFCYICSRNPKNASLAVCAQIQEGLCRKVVCKRCSVESQFGDFEATFQEQKWNCPHCEGRCPARAQCHKYSKASNRRRDTRLKQPKRQARGIRSEDSQKTVHESDPRLTFEEYAGLSAVPGHPAVDASARLATPACFTVSPSDGLPGVAMEGSCMDPVHPQALVSAENAASAHYAEILSTEAATPVASEVFASYEIGNAHQPTITQGFDGGGLPEDLMDLSTEFVPSPEYIELVNTLLSPGGKPADVIPAAPRSLSL